MARKSRDEMLQDLDKKIEYHQHHITELKAKKEKILSAKTKYEIEKLYELLEKSGKTTKDLEALLSSGV
jgi:hypothetical protein